MKIIARSFVHRICIATVAMLLLLLSNRAIAREEHEDRDDRESNAVYVMTNRAEGNTIVAFRRASDGTLTLLEEVSTGGLGSGPIPLPPPIGGPNPLDSQNSLISVRDDHLLLAVNAGSNDISVLAVGRNGLHLIDKVSAGGEFPVSITHHRGLVYVLNSHGTPNITGFFLDFTGRLHRLPGSTRQAGDSGSLPAQVAFSPDGDSLIVTGRLANTISVFRLKEDGRAAAVTTIPSNNHTPFALAFGPHHTVAITESNENPARVAVPNAASVSTYRLTDDSTLIPISKAVPNNQSGTCWIRITPNRKFAFVANTGSGTISSYRLSPNGELSLLAEVAADTGGRFSVPIDLDMTPDGKFIYGLSSLIGTVKGYRIEEDGSLVPIVSIEGFPISVQGIVAR